MKNTKTPIVLTLLFAAALCVAGTRQASASLCAVSPTVNVATHTEVKSIKAAVSAMTGTLLSLIGTESAAAQVEVEFWFYVLEEAIKNRVTWFFSNWTLSPEDGAQGLMTKIIPSQIMGDPATKGMAASEYTGMLQKNISKGQSYDGAATNYASKRAQLAEYEARKLYRPNEAGCQVDTSARYANRSREVSKALAGGYSADFNNIGNNRANTPAGGGKGALHQARWETFANKFCDPKANRGQNGCAYRDEKETTNMHIMPSKTLFGQDTIDLTNPDMRDAVKELMFNITGYETSDSVVSSAQQTSLGQETSLRRREYLAQMDAVGALAYSVVADRAPGVPAPEIQALRQKQGITYASEKPSAYELRQAFIESLWDPNFYGKLYEGESTITQKEVYLKAYGLVLLNDIINKQEKIANAYAIETANMLEQRKPQSSAVQAAPLQ